MTSEQEQQLKSIFPNKRSVEVAEIVGLTLKKVNNWAHKLGLKKSPEHVTAMLAEQSKALAARGAGTRFPKGHVNQFRTYGPQSAAAVATQFKPGKRPHNTVEVGTILPDPDGYFRQKIAEPKVWRYMHRINWEAAHGAIPAGHTIGFKDGNKANYQLDNLELVSYVERMQRSTIHRYPMPLKQAIRTLASVKRASRKRSAPNE